MKFIFILTIYCKGNEHNITSMVFNKYGIWYPSAVTSERVDGLVRALATWPHTTRKKQEARAWSQDAFKHGPSFTLSCINPYIILLKRYSWNHLAQRSKARQKSVPEKSHKFWVRWCGLRSCSIFSLIDLWDKKT